VAASAVAIDVVSTLFGVPLRQLMLAAGFLPVLIRPLGQGAQLRYQCSTAAN
jgi:hypothetical protein